VCALRIWFALSARSGGLRSWRHNA
jgi:hypothetical protein